MVGRHEDRGFLWLIMSKKENENRKLAINLCDHMLIDEKMRSYQSIWGSPTIWKVPLKGSKKLR